MARLEDLADLYGQHISTPWQRTHFNDGDACIFGVRDPEISMAEEPEEFEERWCAKNKEAKHWARLYKLFKVPDEVMKDTFGSDSRVTATRDGFEVEEGFDHD